MEGAIIWQNQGLLGMAFFEATALFILCILFLLLEREHKLVHFRIWLAGWMILTSASAGELAALFLGTPPGILRLLTLIGQVTASVLFLAAVLQYVSGNKYRLWRAAPVAGVALGTLLVLESRGAALPGAIRWETSLAGGLLGVIAGVLLWRRARYEPGLGGKILAAALFLGGFHGLDRPLWAQSPIFLVRVALADLFSVAVGMAMAVFVLEGVKARAEELSEKLRRISLLTTASSQSLSVKDVLNQVLKNLISSLDAAHGAVRLLEGDGEKAELVLHASVGFSRGINEKFARLSILEPWSRRVLTEGVLVQSVDGEMDEGLRERMQEARLKQLVTLPIPGKEGPLGVLTVGTSRPVRFQPDETAFLVNVANLLGLTLQNVNLFEQVSAVQRQWLYTFDSIGDPILVHDKEFRVVRSNLRLGQLLGRKPAAMFGWPVGDIFSRNGAHYKHCPYCEGVAGEGDETDPWLRGYFLASNSSFTDPEGRELGTVHVLKDITERKKAEEKYRSLIASVQEGVFISTPQGRFLDFNDAFLKMTGYGRREELMGVSIPTIYLNPSDRERLKKLLQEHGSVADFEFELVRRDGEVRTMLESSIAVRDAAGNVSAYQGFILDITERKRAEREIRQRNRELMVLNSIGQTLNESLDLKESVRRTLTQLTGLFGLDAAALYLFEQKEKYIQRIASVGHKSAYAENFPATPAPAELLEQIRSVHATFISAQGLPLPNLFRELQASEGIQSAYIVVLWSKDRVIGGLSIESREPREFSPADVNLLVAVGSQVSNALERTLLFEEMRQAYDNLQRTQEQLLHSEKMAAVGQLISGVAHELNNPLTAILGYSQLLTSSGQKGSQAVEYAEKLYKQAQRTHRIVQNLLSFARQRKPERVPVRLNQVIEDTLALRDYDLRLSGIRLHQDLAPDLPLTSADPHQLQQVFLNLVNNAVDAILESSQEGEIRVRTSATDDRLVVEFTDSGPGVKDPSRVFDPFYTTKPVGKGTGLGLSICYGIVSEHGGTIRVQNAVPHGAIFRIELPYRPAEKSAAPQQAQRNGTRRTGRILLVDDDESVLEVVSKILRGEGHLVQTAQTGEQACRELQEGEFDLILADMHLPGSNWSGGFYEWLRRERPSLRERLVLMSSAGAGENSRVGKELEGCCMLQKPFKAGELLAMVGEILQQIHAGSRVA